MTGDAIYAMSPTAGVGAVTALCDAATLGKLLSEEGIKLESLRKYERLMREYAGEGYPEYCEREDALWDAII
jgi:2-polyprenyl-6-methoxyphenol hydroxylase-like FAD-dependent oxidoreductase